MVVANCEPPASLHESQARSSHTITAVGDTIYLFGGEHAPRVPIGSDVHAYNLQERVWRKLQVCGRLLAVGG